MSTIYRKTEVGHAEIATRARKLVPRLRQVLILVDGKRSEDELAKLVTGPLDESLQGLMEQGFIEILSVTSVHVPLQVGPPAVGPSVAPAPAPVTLTLEETRRRAVRWLSDRLGPYADPLNLRIEKSRRPDELNQALVLASSFVRQQLGASRVVEFEQHVGLAAGDR